MHSTLSFTGRATAFLLLKYTITLCPLSPDTVLVRTIRGSTCCLRTKRRVQNKRRVDAGQYPRENMDVKAVQFWMIPLEHTVTVVLVVGLYWQQHALTTNELRSSVLDCSFCFSAIS